MRGSCRSPILFVDPAFLPQAKAYYKPVVTDSNEAFEWGSVDLDGLRMSVWPCRRLISTWSSAEFFARVAGSSIARSHGVTRKLQI